MDEIPTVPGYNTFVIEMNGKISIHLKYIHKEKTFITLRDDGKWVDPITRSFYKIDSDGALWIQTTKKGTDLLTFAPNDKKYIPKNELATKKVRKLKKLN